MKWSWVVWECFLPTVQQGAYVISPVLGTSLLLRLLILLLPLRQLYLETVATLLGAWVLWWYYENSLVYFLLLSAFVYILLLIVPRGHRGVVVGGACVSFIVFCELFVVSAVEWHKTRGSFVILAMKLVCLAFETDNLAGSSSSSDSSSPPVPHPISFLCYSLFPSTTVFGPFITYSDHLKFTTRNPLSLSWIASVIQSLIFALLCLGISVCVAPFVFTEQDWNKWLAAYSTAASFRYSHYFICLLSQSTVLAAGMGFSLQSDGELSWSQFHVVRPINVELPRSLGVVVTSWNLAMHQFLKYYVFKPSIAHLGKFGAILVTYIASALLHGLNFQLAAVLLSIGVYAYIEHVLRHKLSVLLSACVQDRRCHSSCEHRHKENVFWVSAINTAFIFLAMFHLAYLGLMFGGDEMEEEEMVLAAEGYTMRHTLRKWSHLGFLSHWVALGTAVVAWLLPRQ